ncbi:hypothetical protein ARALYDRAFT_916838 [Arabidopsis lyrata subsp. lyrata]|uniref:Uncharacterized protein n=1 Tax=Arabidopsis lyrata subsp. lyrata TaxID=81972 RepID=D7MSN3_ARALL|nr:hypothetical protein ARALYDRAFT_916838 [Arabidopsis lyrata subsp. lyrata]
MQHIPKFMHWLKYLSFMHTASQAGLANGGLQEQGVLLVMAFGYRLCAYFCLRKKISIRHL